MRWCVVPSLMQECAARAQLLAYGTPLFVEWLQWDASGLNRVHVAA
jgi:hypothetical protein